MGTGRGCSGIVGAVGTEASQGTLLHGVLRGSVSHCSDDHVVKRKALDSRKLDTELEALWSHGLERWLQCSMMRQKKQSTRGLDGGVIC